jgi:hypothetical protein
MMTYTVELCINPLIVSANNEEEILVAVREYVAEHGIEVDAMPHIDGDDEPDDDDYLSIVWHPYREMHRGPN